MNLKKVVPPPALPKPEWQPHPTHPHMEVNRVTGFLRTKQPLPPPAPPITLIDLDADSLPYDGS